jgi:hypothetical protein
MISFASTQGTDSLGVLDLLKDSITISDTVPVHRHTDYSFLINQVTVPDSVIAKVYPDTLTYTLSDSLFRDFIDPTAFMRLPEAFYHFNFVPKIQFIQDWSIILFVFLLVVLATIFTTSEKYIAQLFQSLFNPVVANRLYREKVGNMLDVSYRLDFFFLLVTGLFLYHAINFAQGFSPDISLLYFGISLAAVVIYVSLKFLTYRFIGFAFETLIETQEYIFYAKLGNRIMGLILFPIVVALFLIQGEAALFWLILGGIIIKFFSIIGLYRGIRVIAQKVISIYYMILYLCTLEILPLLLLWRILFRE